MRLCSRHISALAVYTFAAAMTLGVDANAAEAGRRAPAKDREGWQISIGAGGAYAPDYEGSDRYRFRPLPYARIAYGDWFEFSGNQLTVPVVKLGRGVLTVGLLTRLGGGRDETDNRADLTGLGNIGPAVEVGGFTRLQFGRIWFGISAGQDVAGGHKGMTVDGSMGVMLPLTSSLSASVSANTTWASRKYMNRFFGVSAAQSAASGLSEFAAESGLKDYGAGLGLSYRLSKSWSLQGGTRYKRLTSDAADNPLVRQRGSKDQVMNYLAMAYTF